jgi:plastocyanin
MLALISSERVVMAVVFGIPLVVTALVVLTARPRLSRVAVVGGTVVAVLLTGIAVWAVFRGAEPTVATGAAMAGLPDEVVGGPDAGGPPTTPGPASPAGPPCSPEGTTLTVVAQETTFDTNCLAAPADTSFSVVLDNQDAGVPHNVAIYENPSLSRRLGGASAPDDFVTGPDQTTYEVGALSPGTYYFQCDLHPPQMNGTFVVA